MSRVNKDVRNLNVQFDQKQFNQKFENNNEQLNKEIKQDFSPDMTIVDDLDEPNIILPHKRSIEDIIIIIRETFFKVMELLSNKENPIPFIMSSPDRFFCMAVVMIILGCMLLLLSNLLKSSGNKNISNNIE
jgi:hypothetical protein